MNRLYEEVKIDIGLVAQALSNNNATGRYYDMSEYRSALAILNGGAMAATKTSKIELFEAKDAEGTDTQLIAGAAATITANALVTEATVDLSAVANTDVVTINGVSFTKAAATDETAREFADAAGLVSCVNDATYGVSGVTASAVGAVVTLQATAPGSVLITTSKTENAGTITLATTKAQAYVEIEALDLSEGFSHIACKVTTTANSVVSAILLRGKARREIEQKAAASAVL